MRKIILTTSFFFCLTITTVLAQVATINIETPSSNGLSNNQVADFDVNTDGTILNNSAADGTAEIGNTAVTGNSNITTGSEASLILFQVTGNSGSDLEGAIEVFGAEAGIIIANPNGIDCDGCGFINTIKVDLITGTANFSGDDLTGFSIDGSSTLTVNGSGFLSDAVADELKLESQNISINAQVRANNSLEIIVNGYTQSGAIDVIGNISIQVTNVARLDDTASIKARTLFFSAYDFYNQADLTITDNATFDIGNDFNNGFYFNGVVYYGGDISADNFNVTAGNNFINRYDATISADNFNVTAGDRFYNRNDATINVDNFNVTADRFYNYATISADSLNISYNRLNNTDIIIGSNASYFGNIFIENVNTLPIVPDGASSTDAIQSSSGVDIINIARPDSNGLSNNSYSDFNISSSGLVFNNSSSAVSSSLAGTIAGNPNYTASDSASLILNQITSNNPSYLGGILEVAGNSAAIIIANPNGIVCDGCSFANTDKVDLITGTANFDTAGVISDYTTAANDVWIFNANIVLSDFNVVAGNNFFNWGNSTISADNFNVIAYDFSNRDSATINAKDFNVTADDFLNLHNATISADNFNVTAYDFSNRDSATINAKDFNVTADDFANYDSATINADNFNLTAEYFYNQDSATINANDFNVTADDFDNYEATINADNFNVVAEENFSNYEGAIINADNFSVTLTNDFDDINGFNNDTNATINAHNFNVTADYFYNWNNATINAHNFNVTADDFSNSATISVDSLNISYNSFDNEGIITDGITYYFGNVFIENVNNLSIVPDGTTLTDAIQSSSGIDIINIARPDSNGLSNNSYSDFNISSSGLVFNNSSSAVSSSLAGTIVGNPNYAASDSASLILNQITSNNLSYLGGILEVAGNSATIIIANPNGIFCDECSFANTDKVDLITGTANFDTAGVISDYTTTNRDIYIHEANIFVKDFNAIAGDDFFNYVSTIDTDSFNVTVGNDFSNEDGAIINADNFNVTAGDGFYNYDNATINADSFNVTAGGSFLNYDNATINANDFHVKAIGSFYNYNSATINANNFNVTTGTNFSNYTSTIDANDLNVTTGGDFTNYRSTIDVDSFNVTTGGDFTNQSSTIDIDSFNVTAGASFQNIDSATISADNFNVIATGDFTNQSATIDAGIVLITTASNFNNSSSVNADILDILLNDATGSFTNTGSASADTFTLSVAGDFDYADRGTVTVNSFNLSVGGDFSNNDSNNNFILDSLTVSGNADITTNNYIQSGAIDVAGALTINANSYTYNSPNSDFVLGENDSLSILGDFIIDTNNYIQFGTLVVDGALTIESDSDFSNSGNITVTGALAIDSDRNFVNSGGITTDSLNITTGYTAINQGSIVSDSLAITANDFFRNLTGGDIDVATLNITAGGKVTNTANITVGTLNIIANNDSSRTNDTTAFYVANRGNITATTLNIAAVDNFYNRGNIAATNFNITRAKAIFFLNKEIDSFYAAGHIYDGGNISLSGDSSFRADGGIIENYGNIDLGDFNLDITANRFINQAGANVTANTVNLDVNSLIQHGFINAAINHQ